MAMFLAMAATARSLSCRFLHWAMPLFQRHSCSSKRPTNLHVCSSENLILQ
ncbi:unnamed protein product, partial [Larinioides sclopetarius]